MKICRNCKHYESETFTSTGKGIAYCYEKESRRYGLLHGSIQILQRWKSDEFFRSRTMTNEEAIGYAAGVLASK